jgi:hypothetical protein
VIYVTFREADLIRVADSTQFSGEEKCHAWIGAKAIVAIGALLSTTSGLAFAWRLRLIFLA